VSPPLCLDCHGTGTTRIGTVCLCPVGERLLEDHESGMDLDDLTTYECALDACDGDDIKAGRLARSWGMGKRQRIPRVA